MDKKNKSTKYQIMLSGLGKNMFIWVVVGSVVASISIVLAILFVQRILFMNKVISEKDKTYKTLIANNKAIPDLQNSIRALNSNQELINSKAKLTDEAIQVVLDALPTEPNYAALGASFQQVLLANTPGITVVNLTINKDQNGTSTTSSNQSKKVPGAYEILFSFSVKGDTKALYNLLSYLERSIRVLSTKTMTITSSGNEQVLTVTGAAYYQPEKTVKVTSKDIKQ